MAKPENDQNLPIPENPDNGVSFVINNFDCIYEIAKTNFFSQSKRFVIDDDHYAAFLTTQSIKDGLIKEIEISLIGLKQQTKKNELSFGFGLRVIRESNLDSDTQHKELLGNILQRFKKVENIIDSDIISYRDHGINIEGCGFFFKKDGSRFSLNLSSEGITLILGDEYYMPLSDVVNFRKFLDRFVDISGQIIKIFYQEKHEVIPSLIITVDSPKRLNNLDSEECNQSCKNMEVVSRREGFGDIAGQSRAVAEAKKLVLAINHPEVYEKRGVKTPKGILFYGPPGTGKTLIAKAIASEIDAELFEVSFSDIGSKWYGESEQRIQEIFNNANKITKTGRKVIILFDELDSMAPSRSDSYEGSKKIVSIMLQNLDGFRSNKDVLIIGTTNRPEDIDPALKRPGRIDKIIAVGLPELEDRKAILQLHINKAIERSTTSHDLFSSELDLQKIAESTDGMSGADLANVLNLTLESKTILELEGLRWTPVTNADIERTLVDFKLKQEEKRKIGFN